MEGVEVIVEVAVLPIVVPPILLLLDAPIPEGVALVAPLDFGA